MSKLYFYKFSHFLLFYHSPQFCFINSTPIRRFSPWFPSFLVPISRIPTPFTRISIIPTLIPHIPTQIPHIPIIPTLIPHIPMISLIPFSDSSFWFLQISSKDRWSLILTFFKSNWSMFLLTLLDRYYCEAIQTFWKQPLCLLWQIMSFKWC